MNLMYEWRRAAAEANERHVLVDDAGPVGSVEMTGGGSWALHYKATLIGFRPDLDSAKTAVEKVHQQEYA